MAWTGVAAQPEPVVNVPYPLSPDEAAQRFLYAVDGCRPRSWTGGMPAGAGAHLATGIVQAKAKAPDGGTVLMIGMPRGDSALVRCAAPIPEISVGQKVYVVVDFDSPDGPSVARLRGIVSGCDLGAKCILLDTMLGLAPATLPPAPAPAPSPPTPAPAVPPAPGPAPRPAPNGDTSCPTKVTWTPVSPDQTSADAAEAARVAYWKEYIAKHNRALTDIQREAIVRWVIYYAVFFGVDHRLVFSVMRWESDFDPGCLSHAGAMGLMQLMPETCKDLGVNPWIVEENIRGGIQELVGYLDKYAGRPNYEQCSLSLACYNAGAGAVKRAGGIPNIPETINYVKRVTDAFADFVRSGAP
jgi:soluble lytic murein transglycosylase-like protein